MEWHNEAEEALKRAPVFVRKMVRKKIEEYAQSKGCSIVSIAEVQEARKTFKQGQPSAASAFSDQQQIISFDDGDITSEKVERIENLSEERGVVKTSYSIIKVCGAPFGCPRHVMDPGPLMKRLADHLEESGYREFLEENVEGPVLTHHKFRISLAGCPNACSQPQIMDLGIIGCSIPEKTGNACIECMECVAACHEKAVEVAHAEPMIDYVTCVGCGDCARACPTGTLTAERKGYTILAGGRLGRHPQFGEEIIHLASEDEAATALDACIYLYLKNVNGVERFTSVFNRLGAETVRREIDRRLRGLCLPFDPEGDDWK